MARLIWREMQDKSIYVAEAITHKMERHKSIFKEVENKPNNFNKWMKWDGKCY